MLYVTTRGYLQLPVPRQIRTLRRARSIQPKFPEISVQNSMDRFGPTGKVSKKRVHLLRWTTFPGRTGWNFGWMDRARRFLNLALLDIAILEIWLAWFYILSSWFMSYYTRALQIWSVYASLQDRCEANCSFNKAWETLSLNNQRDTIVTQF